MVSSHRLIYTKLYTSGLVSGNQLASGSTNWNYHYYYCYCYCYCYCYGVLQVARAKSWQPVVGGSSGAARSQCSHPWGWLFKLVLQANYYSVAWRFCMRRILLLGSGISTPGASHVTPRNPRHSCYGAKPGEKKERKREERKKHAVTHAQTTRTTQTRASCHPSYPPTAEPREFSAPAPKRLYLVFSSPPSMRHAENHQKS